jgi:hypothetical protein
MPERDWSAIFPTFHELEVSVHKTDQIAKAAVIDMKSEYSVISVLNEEYDFDSDSETDSVLSEDNLEDLVEDLNVYMESLAELSPSLNHPAADSVIIETAAVTLADGLLSIPDHVRPFALIINDRFPSLDIGFVRKLGETNWQRRERLRAKFASAPAFDENAFNNDDDSSADATVVDGNHSVAPSQQSSYSNIRSRMSHPSTHQTITTASGFSEPSIFDNQSISIRISGPRTAESVTSFATSLADGLEHGQRQIPKLPENHDYGSAFQCTICGEILTQVRTRADWKYVCVFIIPFKLTRPCTRLQLDRTHVYDDLEPYVCLFTDCSLGLQTFKSRREWMNHEFQVHRVTTRWACSLCKVAFDSKQLLRSHITDSHSHHFAASQIEEMVAASKRILPCTVSNELCPFCLTAPAQTQKGFASHVGKHQQEISLAALPRLDDTSGNDGADDDDEDDDSDDNDKKPSESIRSNSSMNTLDHLSFDKEGPSESRRLPFPSNISDKGILVGDSPKYGDIGSQTNHLDQNSQRLKTDSVAFSTVSFSMRLRLDRLLLETADSCQLIMNGLQRYDNKKVNQVEAYPEVHSTPALWASNLRKSVTKLKHIVSNIPVYKWAFSDSSYRTFINVLETYLSQSNDIQKALSEGLLAQDSKGSKKRLSQLFRAKPELKIERKSRPLQAEARKAAQELLDSLSSEQISEMKLESDDDKWHEDPRIRGTKVHDFSSWSRKIDRGESYSNPATSKSSNLKDAHEDVPSRLSSNDATLQHAAVAETSEVESTSNSEKYSSLATQLYDAVEGENLDQVKKLLLSETYLIRNSIDRPGGHHGTALHAAAYYDNESVVNLLLNHGADVNANCGHYGTALQAAAASTVGRLDKCSTSMIELLIQRGADVNAKGGVYGTALHAAAASLRSKEFQSRAVQHLLDRGADVNATGGYYHTALQAAAANGSAELLQLLLERGADLSIKGGYYGTAIIAAAGLDDNLKILPNHSTQTFYQKTQKPNAAGSWPGIFQGEIAIRRVIGSSRSHWYVRLLSINNRGELSSWGNSPIHLEATRGPKRWEIISDLKGCSVESFTASPENGIESDLFMICDPENIPILELNPKSTEDPHLWFRALSHWKDFPKTAQVNQHYGSELDHSIENIYRSVLLPDSRLDDPKMEKSKGVVVTREFGTMSITNTGDQGKDSEQKSV